MKTVLKYIGIFVLTVLAACYFYFLKFLPVAVDLNAFVPEIQKLIKKNTGFDLNIGNIKLITTPLLGVGVNAEDISVDLPDKSRLFNAAALKTKISLPHLLLLDVHISDISLYKPVINLEIANGKEFKAIKAVEELLLENEKKQTVEALRKTGFDPLTLIKINAPSFKIYDYRAYISDMLTKEYLLLQGDNAKIGYFNGKRAKIETLAKLYLNQEKQIDFDININSFIPKAAELDEEDDPSVRAEVPFINPVLTYKNYDPKGEIHAKMKLDKKDIHGFFALENLTLDIKGYKIPKSHIRAKFTGDKIFTDSDIYLAKSQHLRVFGRVKNSKRPDFDLDVFSSGVYFNDLILLAKGVLDSAGIKNDLSDIKGEGYFSADLHAKTNSKNLKSRGKFEIKDGAIVNSRTGLGLKNIKALVLLDGNTLEIKNSGFNVNNGTLRVEGKIDKKTDTDIKVTADLLPLPELFRAFAPDDIKKQINFLSGKLSFNAGVSGKMKNAAVVLMTRIDDLKISDKPGTLVLSNKSFKFDANINKKLNGKLTNSEFEIALPYSHSSIRNNLTEISVDDKNLTLNPTQFKVNKGSAVTFSGSIEDYAQRPVFNFHADGSLYSNELKELLGAVAVPFVDTAGLIPVKASFSGNYKKQTLQAQALADSANYLTPVHIKSIQNNQTISQLLVDFKGNRVKIKNTGLYSKLVPSDFTDDFALNMIDACEIAGIEGTIAGIDSALPVINMLKLNLPKPLELNIAGFKDSYVALSGKLSIYGNADSPRYRGHFTADNVLIPDAVLEMKQGKISLNGKDAKITTEGLTVNDSDIEVSAGVNLAALPLISLNNLKIGSNNIDVDRLTEVFDHILLMIPADPVPRPEENIPAVITSGGFDIKTVKTGNINVKNLDGRLRLVKNILFIDNIRGALFNGNFSGNVNVSLLNYLVNADISGKNMDANNALVILAEMKDALSGELSFDTKISLQGLTFEEQINSLNGTFNFLIKDGQAGPFAKIENVFLSENLRDTEFFQGAIGSVITSAVSVDTSRFQELKGTINFKKDGVAYIEPITMQGAALCLKIFGCMDVLKNALDAKVRGRLGSMLDSMLGPLANVNPVNIVKATPGLNVAMAKTFSVFCEKVSQEEMESIPDFSKDRSDFNATKFQIVLRGDAAKPLTLLKSFKWLVTEEEYGQAENYVSAIPDELPEGISTLEEMRLYQAELAAKEAEAKTLKGRLKNLFKRKESV